MKLFGIGKSVVAVSHPRQVYFRRVIRHRGSGSIMRLGRIVPLSPRGLRAYYSDSRGHFTAVDRDGVTKIVGQTHDRVLLGN